MWSITSSLVVSANASPLMNVRSLPSSAARPAVAIVRYHPAVAVRRPGAFSNAIPTPLMPCRTSPATVAASPYPELDPMTSATGRWPGRPSGFAGTCARMSATLRSQPVGWESSSRNPRPVGLITRSAMTPPSLDPLVTYRTLVERDPCTCVAAAAHGPEPQRHPGRARPTLGRGSGNGIRSGRGVNAYGGAGRPGGFGSTLDRPRGSGTWPPRLRSSRVR